MAPGERNKFGAPHVRTWGLSEANVLYWRKYLQHCWDFSAPPKWFGAWGIVPRLPPSLRPCVASSHMYYLENNNQRSLGATAPIAGYSRLDITQTHIDVPQWFWNTTASFSSNYCLFDSVRRRIKVINFGTKWNVDMLRFRNNNGK